MEENIRKALVDNLHLIIDCDKEDLEEDYGKWECIEMAGNLIEVFTTYDTEFTVEQKIAAIKYECCVCWHEVVSDDVYIKVYNDIHK